MISGLIWWIIVGLIAGWAAGKVRYDLLLLKHGKCPL